MNEPQRQRPEQRRSAQAKRSGPIDIWRPVAALPDPEPITVPDDVGALLRSLGDPPISDSGSIANHYFTAVVQRAAVVAAALARIADIPGQPDQ
jgi:hypothetical protein